MAKSVDDAVKRAEELADEVEAVVNDVENVVDDLGDSVENAENVAGKATVHLNKLSALVVSSYETVKNLPRPTQVALAVGSAVGAVWYFGLI